MAELPEIELWSFEEMSTQDRIRNSMSEYYGLIDAYKYYNGEHPEDLNWALYALRKAIHYTMRLIKEKHCE